MTLDTGLYWENVADRGWSAAGTRAGGVPDAPGLFPRDGKAEHADTFGKPWNRCHRQLPTSSMRVAKWLETVGTVTGLITMCISLDVPWSGYRAGNRGSGGPNHVFCTR